MELTISYTLPQALALHVRGAAPGPALIFSLGLLMLNIHLLEKMSEASADKVLCAASELQLRSAQPGVSAAAAEYAEQLLRQAGLHVSVTAAQRCSHRDRMRMRVAGTQRPALHSGALLPPHLCQPPPSSLLCLTLELQRHLMMLLCHHAEYFDSSEL